MSSYILASPVDVVSSSSNAQINLFSTGSVFAAQFQAPSGLIADVDFTLPTTTGSNGQFLQRTGASSLGWTNIYGPMLPMQLRTYRNSTTAKTTTNTTLQVVSTFYFQGSTALGGNPAAAYIIFSPSTNATTCQARISDLTNTTTIATVTSGTFTAGTLNLINFGALSNIPTGPAIWQLTFARPAGATASIYFFEIIF